MDSPDDTASTDAPANASIPVESVESVAIRDLDEWTRMDNPHQPEIGFAEVNGASLYYEVAGSGHPLLLLHGGLVDQRMWDEQFPVFAAHFRVVRYDARGYGRSNMPAGPYSPVEDLRGLLGWLGIERAHLVGLSGGGWTAVEFALAYPEAVAALVLAASGIGGYAYVAPELEQYGAELQAAIAAQDLERAVEATTRLWTDGPRRTPDEVDPAVRRRVRQMTADRFAKPWDLGSPQWLDPPSITRLDEIRAPTLVLAGDHDVADILTIAQRLAAGIPGAHLVLLPGVAHMVNMERPVEFNRLVLAFLKTR